MTTQNNMKINKNYNVIQIKLFNISMNVILVSTFINWY